MLEQVLIALIPGLAKLIESALDDDYDQEKELQAILQLQRAAADLRLQRMLAARK